MADIQPALKQKRVYVYADSGVGANSLKNTLCFFGPAAIPIRAKQVQRGHWKKKAALFVIPGGEDIPYTKKLNGKGNQQIRDYVQQGGVYVGICAGAYYACSHIEFDLHGPREIIGARELAFYPGKAVGPIQRGPCWVWVNDTQMLLQDGPAFKQAENFAQVSILGRYDTGAAAIISVPIGLGFAVLSGVHFEYGTACQKSPI